MSHDREQKKKQTKGYKRCIPFHLISFIITSHNVLP